MVARRFELHIPRPVLEILERLEKAGFEVWCVGGAIRDQLFKQPGSDFDLTTSARPEDVQRLFRRTVPIGIEHGTVAVLDADGSPHEVTTFRRDVRTDGRHAEVEFGVSLHDDLARRDFTINAIAYHPPTDRWEDPFDGRGDIDRRVVRAVGDPAQRFEEDYLRILRALRFSNRFGAEIEPKTWSAMCVASGGLGHLSAERVRDEWFKGIRTARSVRRLVEQWREVGALAAWLPEATHDDPLDDLPKDPVLVTAAVSSAPDTSLARLRASNAEIARGGAVRALRERPLPAPEDGEAVRRWLAMTGDRWADLLALARRPDLHRAVEREQASRPPLRVSDLRVTGHDVMAAGFEGPDVGRVLDALLDGVLRDPSANTADALRRRIEDMRDR